MLLFRIWHHCGITQFCAWVGRIELYIVCRKPIQRKCSDKTMLVIRR
jgi:hypothetical protein